MARIDALQVVEPLRRSGWGRAALDALLADARAQGLRQAVAAAGDLAFYAACGFAGTPQQRML